MGLFDKPLEEIDLYLAEKRKEGIVTDFQANHANRWPASESRNLVLGQDTAVELGNPKDGSSAFLLWHNHDERNTKNNITLIGPDLPQIKEGRVSFGKIVIVEGDGFTPENSYDRYLMMDQVKFDIHLDGYMMRGASQILREWSRISKTAIQDGFSFRHLGSALLDKLLAIDFVRSARVIFITSSPDDIIQVQSIAENSLKIIGALNKMTEEMSFDCDSCEYNDVCSDVADLRAMRKRKGNTR